jgi:hypothetical protein
MKAFIESVASELLRDKRFALFHKNEGQRVCPVTWRNWETPFLGETGKVLKALCGAGFETFNFSQK